MEMERINENTIRVLIENEDLEERGITFLDLLGNHKQIENFFYSILEEVDIDEQFQETDAVTFQVLPNRNGLELFISKNMMMGEDGEIPELSEMMNQETFGEFVKNQMTEGTPLAETNTQEEVNNYINNLESPLLESVVKFDSFEDVIQLSRIAKMNNVVSHLYQMKDDLSGYFLHVVFYLEDTTETQVNDDMALILEFGHLTTVAPEVLAEYGQLIMEQSALKQTQHYFKK
ncbi:adaptor protein MecA [Vagococcus salmoninarum]|uniref:adaptor protein MecA n=1 Tax=Vagococcus salmoninarum TaxID=2739 RepID=UPI003F9B082C